ncbi:MAG: hypothetical protein CW346_18545 [Bacillaceae bacterium]|nr:hypothetical protein [Bacillaceae bacterium]
MVFLGAAGFRKICGSFAFFPPQGAGKPGFPAGKAGAGLPVHGAGKRKRIQRAAKTKNAPLPRISPMA